jgi:hypothetical protein
MDAGANLQEQAYNALNAYFIGHEDDIVEIEILPPAIQPSDGLFMEDGLSIGVPKKVLMLAYLAARELFFASLETEGVRSQKAFEASRVILLFDPEHITAANFRKRRLLKIADVWGAERELIFLNSILTSPLHRQSKSPTLWHHRAWLLGHLLPLKSSVSNMLDDEVLLLSFAQTELDAVCKAGERHPKNYYAWQYLRRLFTRVAGMVPAMGYFFRKPYNRFVEDCTAHVATWCIKHPSDISGWSFLTWVLSVVTEVNQRWEIVDRTLNFMIALKWEGEAFWTFVRTVLGGTVLKERRQEVIEKLHNYERGLRKIQDEEYEEARNVKKAVDWLKVYGTPLSSKTEP